MSFLGGILKSVINPATLFQLAMGPAGWASLATKMIVSAVAQQVIQQLGQQLGLPQSIINMAQTAFSAASGTGGMPSTVSEAVSQLAEQFNLSPSQQGELQREGQTSTRRLVDQLMESEEFKSARSGAKGGKGGESILMRIAIALGQLADKKMGEMDKLATQIGATKDGKDQNKITEQGARLQALGQEMSILSNAMTNVIKSIGEANSTIARKG
jgi:hypothetical protein